MMLDVENLDEGRSVINQPTKFSIVLCNVGNDSVFSVVNLGEVYQSVYTLACPALGQLRSTLTVS